MPPHLSIIIPAYNEERRLGSTLERISAFLSAKPYSFEIIVVDNASRDATAAVASSHPGVRLLSEPIRGKGAAVRTGILAAGGDYLLFSDADLSTPVEELDRLFAALGRGYDLAIASRGLPASRLVVRQPLYRELIGRAGNLLVRLLLLPGIADTQCGFKLFPRELARQLLTGWAFDMEVLFLARRLGCRIAEVPVTWVDSPESRIHPLYDSLGALRDLFLIRWNQLRGRYRQTLRASSPPP
jgi:dolichyl-phosphate beta-glucosyltransferase